MGRVVLAEVCPDKLEKLTASWGDAPKSKCPRVCVGATYAECRPQEVEIIETIAEIKGCRRTCGVGMMGRSLFQDNSPPRLIKLFFSTFGLHVEFDSFQRVAYWFLDGKDTGKGACNYFIVRRSLLRGTC